MVVVDMNTASGVPEAKAVADPPTDGITALQYVRSGDAEQRRLLASTSWDGSVRLHCTNDDTRSCVLRHNMQSGPLLSLAVMEERGGGGNANKIVTGGSDGSIRQLDLATSQDTLIGKHTTNDEALLGVSVACSCLSAVDEHVLVSAGWHKQLHLWDARVGHTISTLPLPGKAWAMDLDPSAARNLLAVATSGRRICLVDLRRLDASSSSAAAASNTIVLPPTQPQYTLELSVDRESSLKYQTRCLSFFRDGHAIGLGSIEGRAAVEYLEETGRAAPAGQKPFAFKCHRRGALVYPVNAVACHPLYTTTFCTGGCDGTVVLWDAAQKKKITALPPLPTAVAALAFCDDGTELAIASSYTFEEGEREHPKDEIYIRPLLPSEYMPKSSSSSKASDS